MNRGWNKWMMGAAAILVLTGCQSPLFSNETAVNETIEETVEESVTESEEESQALKTATAATEPGKPGLMQAEDPRPKEENSETEEAFTELVGIRGHIKEIWEDEGLISSDTDDFPGVFRVRGMEQLGQKDVLKGGTSVFVVMEDLGETGEDRIPIYQGKELYVLSDEERGQVDLLLTSAPDLALTDPLSSTYSDFRIRSGNYSWNQNLDGEAGSGVIACGTAPLDEAASEHAAKLTVPKYNRMEKTPYMISTEIMPDKLVVCQWSAADIGNQDAKEERRITYYETIPMVELEKGKVYEFSAEWKKEKSPDRKFWGNAGYVLVTE